MAWGAPASCRVATGAESYGRYVVADRDMSPGDVVLDVLSYAFTISDAHRKRVCAWCMRWSADGRLPLSCSKCDIVYFCSQSCLDMCMNASLLGGDHARACGLYRRINSFASSKDAAAVLRLVAQLNHRKHQESNGAALCIDICSALFDPSFVPPPAIPLAIPPIGQLEALSLDDSPSTTDSGDPAPAVPLEPPFYHVVPTAEQAQERAARTASLAQLVQDDGAPQLVLRPPTWADVDLLAHHLADWPADTARQWKKDVRFLSEALNAAGFGCDETGVLELVGKVESNSFGLWSSSGVPFGRALVPLASYFNHSCDRNCAVEQDTAFGHMRFRATRDIRKGEELTIRYAGAGVPVSRRTELLQEGYYFTCMCALCVAEREQPGRSKHTYDKSTRGEHKPKQLKKKALYTR